MEFMLGLNYWDSEHGTEMWKNFDASVIEKDMKAISELNVKYLRVFPNWRDFQPVKAIYGFSNEAQDYVNSNDESPLKDETGVDPKQIENFCVFADICDKYGIKLVVSVVTGWMSGRTFVPQILEGRNLIADPFALMWTVRYVKGFVNGTKHLKNIVMWDLGNECNCLSSCPTEEQAFMWTATVSNAIRSCDSTRAISSGMHGLTEDKGEVWTIRDQGELTDYVTTHPYLSPSANNHIDAPNKMRSTIFPTTQSMYYKDLSGKPVIMQEQGSFTDSTANDSDACDFMRANVWSCLSNNIKGYFWWCAHEYANLNYAPYEWSFMESLIGVLDLDLKPKKIGLELKKISETISGLPFNELPPKETDGACVLTKDVRWEYAGPSLVLAKQAGFDLTFTIADRVDAIAPKTGLYVMPWGSFWTTQYKRVSNEIFNAVFECGATLFITYNGGFLFNMEEMLGLKSHGSVTTNKHHKASFEFGELEYFVEREILLSSVGAEVLAKNEEGNIVFSKNKYGKGTIYFLNFPLERMLYDKYAAFNDTLWYKIYEIVGENVLKNKIVVSKNPQIVTTLHKLNSDKFVVCAVNYSDKNQKNELVVKDGWVLEPVYGSLSEIGKCDGAIYYAVKR